MDCQAPEENGTAFAMLQNIVTHHQLTCLTVLRTVKFYITQPHKALRVERREWEKYLAGRKLQKLGFTDYYVKGKLPVGAIEPDCADLLNIYNLIRSRKPRVVFEFGSGCSTLIIAQGMMENERETSEGGEFYSFESSRYWHEQTKGYIPEHLNKYCSLLYREPEIVEVNGTRTWSVKNLPEIRPNFVYIDGPLATKEIPIIGLGVILEEGAPDDYYILIDGHGNTFRFTKENLKKKYKFYENRVHYYRICEPIQ